MARHIVEREEKYFLSFIYINDHYPLLHEGNLATSSKNNG